jgi:NDP-sugar pyrophosphorylase family protein
MKDFGAAMVLAAGRGERMRPLSTVLPKPALPLTDGPVIASALRLAARAGVGRIVVNTFHLGPLMASAVEDASGHDPAVALSPENTLMGTAGGLALARDRGLLGSEGSVLIVNADGILDLDLAALVDRHASSSDAVTLALLPHPDPTRWSRVTVDTRGLVIAIRPPGRAETEDPPWVYPGVMAVGREALNALPSIPGEIPDRLWLPALEAGKLGAAMITGEWREIGTPDDYLAVIMHQLGGGSVIHPTAVVASTAVITTAFVGRYATIGDRAVVRRSVVADGSTVAAGASITDSVLLGSARAATAENLTGEFRVGPHPQRAL